MSVYISLNDARGLVELTYGGRFGALLVYGESIGKGLKLGSGQGLSGGILAFLRFGIIYWLGLIKSALLEVRLRPIVVV